MMTRQRKLLDKALVIEVGWQGDGGTYSLHPASRERIQEAYPEAVISPGIFLRYDKTHDYERFHRPYWEHIALMLTGLKPEQIAKLGGVHLWDPVKDVELWVWKPEINPR